MKRSARWKVGEGARLPGFGDDPRGLGADGEAYEDSGEGRFVISAEKGTARSLSRVFQQVQIELRLEGLLPEGRSAISLPEGTINNMGWTYGARAAPEPGVWRSITIDASDYDPHRAAYLPLRELYAWFGHSQEAIPYVRAVGNFNVIDTDKIVEIK